MDTATKAGPTRSQEPGEWLSQVGIGTQSDEPFLLLPQVIRWESDEKWSSQDLDTQPYRILAWQVAATMPVTACFLPGPHTLMSEF